MSWDDTAVKQAFHAGLTIGVGSYYVTLSAAIKTGLLTQELVDEINSAAERSSEIIATTAQHIKKADAQ